MKQALQLQLGHQLKMTPQLQQAIRLLQLSALDLQAEVREALDSNLMLEAVEEEDTQDPQPVPEGIYASTGSYEVPETQAAEPQSLHDYLHWQLELTPFTPADARIARVLIECIDEGGYLDTPLEEVQATLKGDVDTGIDVIEAVLHRIQRFDPVGVGARTPTECLDVQLGQLACDTPGLSLAKRLVGSHLEDMATQDTATLAAMLAVTGDELVLAMELVRTLNPRPGASFTSTTTEYVVPDVIVIRVGDRWRAELNPELQPRLRINPDYARLVGDTGQSEVDHACMREHMQQASWLMKGLQQRAQTLSRVANFIVEHQHDYFEHGDTAMKPLILREVATALDMHESTVSRVTANKWMHTPRGVVEFRHFFSSQLGTTDGGSTSATAVRAVMRRLFDAEDPREPLSDNSIKERLTVLGYRVARRTIAKYRENMSIPPASERRRLN